MFPLSIIVPVYNVEKYLNCCIESILNQSFTDFELILVDDGSPDSCGKICDDYAKKDARIKVIHKVNGGLSSARNAGLDIAQGEYISFIDSDDVIDSNMFLYLMDKIREYDLDIVTCGIVFFYNNDLCNTQTCVHTNEEYIEKPQSIKLLLVSDGVGDYAVNKIYRKELFNGIRFPESRFFEDIFTTYKVFYSANNILTTDRDLYYYRYSNNSISHSSRYNRNFIDYIIAIEEQLDFVRKNNPSDISFAINKYLLACMLVMRHIVRHNRVIRNRSLFNSLKLRIRYLLEFEDCSVCSDDTYSEAKNMVNNTFLWIKNYKKVMFINSLHNHPRIQSFVKMILGNH